MQTEQDSELVRWIGGLGAASAEHVMARFGMCRSRAYRRLSSLSRHGLLDLRRLLHGRPGLYVASRQGLRWQGLSELGVFRVAPGGFEHAWRVADAAVALCCGLPEWRVLSDREVRWHEREQRELLASVRVGSRGGGVDALHRPDLVLLSPSGRVVAVEIELSVKARWRLVAICQGWARARHLDRVYYLALPAAAGAVGRAVKETRAEDRVSVLALEDVELLMQRERGNA